ncbi:copper amine oxidase [Streptomyces sp. NRRL S-87]|uniref:copper amine oxidase n=1 Tax=Streptomyces sp. NRRL S-87 TaxID=1463920 RepID=UPI0004BFA520|nr:copper amine oxidase [Streptomyces sp. NRRL S-87]
MHLNRIHRARRRAAVALAASALLGGATAAAGPASAAPRTTPSGTVAKAPAARAGTTGPDCSAAYRIEQTLTGGTTWRMCWRYESEAGLVLDQISYQPKGEAKPIMVLTSAKLGQIHVPYDDGKAEYDDLTGAGFGSGLQGMLPDECPGGTVKTVKVVNAWDQSENEVKGLCATTRARGHAYRMAGDQQGQVWQEQGKDLLVYTVNKVGWYEYITEWRFQADGLISANVGATGSLSPGDYDAGDGRGWPIGEGATSYATSHSHNIFWRLNFALDGTPGGRVEQYDSVVTPRPDGSTPTTVTTRTPVTKELAGDARSMRWWRVVSATGKNKDGHERSYEIVPGASSKYSGRPYTRHDVYFTEYKACEQFATNNLRNCGPDAGRSVDTWVNGETLKNPIAWVNIGFHHVARDEDQQPMPVHWQGFQLMPRDVTAMNPLTPPALAGANGRPQ